MNEMPILKAIHKNCELLEKRNMAHKPHHFEFSCPPDVHEQLRDELAGLSRRDGSASTLSLPKYLNLDFGRVDIIGSHDAVELTLVYE